jgi:hypothetical protein
MASITAPDFPGERLIVCRNLSQIKSIDLAALFSPDEIVQFLQAGTGAAQPRGADHGLWAGLRVGEVAARLAVSATRAR